MNLERLENFFSTSPAAKLLRSPLAAQILTFLHEQFKSAGAIVRPHSELAQKLAAFQEHLHATEPDLLRDRPETYLTAWSSGDSRWLRRFLDTEHNEPVYELSTHTEDVLKFLGEVLDRNIGFVGTESRLKRIIDTLTDIVIRGSADPEARLNYLRNQKEQLEQEIAAIESGESVDTYTPTAIRERFADALSDLTSLQGDFRAVEESFKNITKDVQQRQLGADGTRGEILGYALDAESSLKEQDQGISFDEFVRLVLSPAKQDELATIVARLEDIEVLQEQIEGTQKIRGMMGSLSDEAEKVLKTTRRLSATLRRLLDSQATASRQRLANVLREIRTAAIRQAEQPHDDSMGIDVYTDLELLNVWERSFWTAPAQFEQITLNDEQPDQDDSIAVFRQLAEMRRLDWTTMRGHIAHALRENAQISLCEILERHPPESGAIEILGYIQIAHDDGHQVDSETSEFVSLPAERTSRNEWQEGASCTYEVPKVVFCKSKSAVRLRKG